MTKEGDGVNEEKKIFHSEAECPACQENSKSKPSWGPGPWRDEPNFHQFKAHGFICILHRGYGSWCGYVGVPPGHPAHGKNHEEVDVSVHGGLTYSKPCANHVCHVPEPGEEENLHWLGFDCSHFMDFNPAIYGTMKSVLGREPAPAFLGQDHYWTMGDAKAETERLAAQLKALAEKRRARRGKS